MASTMRELLNIEIEIEIMSLGVDIENKNALSLYVDCSFKTVTAYDSMK
ncbi:hypothetical protein ACER0A_009455 [Haloimpatiens sp. FM7315]